MEYIASPARGIYRYRCVTTVGGSSDLGACIGRPENTTADPPSYSPRAVSRRGAVIPNERGTPNLHVSTADDAPVLAWIVPRAPYCDRGHYVLQVGSPPRARR